MEDPLKRINTKKSQLSVVEVKVSELLNLNFSKEKRTMKKWQSINETSERHSK